jgi:hypothetical protein
MLLLFLLVLLVWLGLFTFNVGGGLINLLLLLALLFLVLHVFLLYRKTA